jgi:hypothetical protein
MAPAEGFAFLTSGIYPFQLGTESIYSYKYTYIRKTAASQAKLWTLPAYAGKIIKYLSTKT